MSIFVFLSGYLTPSKKECIVHSLKKIIVLYVVFQTSELILHGILSIKIFIVPCLVFMVYMVPSIWENRNFAIQRLLKK